MIKCISIERYRKLKNINFEFSKNINVLSGTNGTCKTSLLHIVSNSFQAVNKSCDWVSDKNCIDCIRTINNSFNPKIESLTKGDKIFNDPAPNHKGVLYKTKLIDGRETSFRRHESKKNSRYAVKPYYKIGCSETLPFIPIIYLGLSRLFPYGEFQNDELIKKLNKNLPDNYQEEVRQLYERFTGISITYACQQNMGDVKKRAEFVTDQEGIDSNTISAGEDHLYIILTALVSLKYYYESIVSNNEVESILLIDEMDATLHPAFQLKLFDLFFRYSIEYKIQIFFTSHSLSLIEYAIQNKANVTYLLDNIDNVFKIEDVDIYKIKTHLYQKTNNSLYLSSRIPIFTEDEEARFFLDIIKDYLCDKDRDGFAKVSNCFYPVNACIGADNLKNIFKDSQLLRSTIRSICILDGDQHTDLTNHIITLPGQKSPEELIIKYASKLYQDDDTFWVDEIVVNRGYTKVWYRDNFAQEVNENTQKYTELISQNKPTKGFWREKNKALFNKYKEFFGFLFKHWVNNPVNKPQLKIFYDDLFILFKKVAVSHDINPNDWVKLLQF